MKTLSFLQPWASALIFLGKDVENRTWKTDFTGDLVVHASKGWDKQGEAFIRRYWERIVEPMRQKPQGAQWFLDGAQRWRGGFIGVVTVTGCKKYDDEPIGEGLKANPWAFGPYCWPITNPRPTNSMVSGNGQLGFFKFNGDLYDAKGALMIRKGDPV